MVADLALSTDACPTFTPERIASAQKNNPTEFSLPAFLPMKQLGRIQPHRNLHDNPTGPRKDFKS